MRWRILILAGAMLAVYGPGLFLTFGFYDDYYALNWARNGSDKLFLFCTAQGRPLDGLIADLAFKIPNSIHDLVWLRLATLAGLATFAWMVGASLIRAGWPKAHALCLSIVVATLPAAQVYAVWSIEIAKPWSGVLAGVAAVLAFRAAERRRSAAWTMAAGAALALLAAFTIYQPGAMIFFVFVAISLFRPSFPSPCTQGEGWGEGSSAPPARPAQSPERRPSPYPSPCVQGEGKSPDGTQYIARLVPRLAIALLVAAVALGGEWILFRTASHRIDVRQFPGASIVQRAAVISPAQLYGKIVFFIEGPLNESLRGAFIRLPSAASVAIASLIAIGLLFYMRGRIAVRIMNLFIAAALLPVTFACNLLTVDNAAAYRMQVAVECLVAVYALFAIQGWWSILSPLPVLRGRVREGVESGGGVDTEEPPPLPSPWVQGEGERAREPIVFVPIVVPAALALLSCLAANHYFTAYLAVPQAMEWSAVESMARQVNRDGVNRVLVVRAPVEPVFAPAHLREFGLPTSTRDFAAADLVELAIRTVRTDMPDVPVTLVDNPEAAAKGQATAGTAVVDLRRLNSMGASVNP